MRDNIKIAYIGGGSRGWAWGLMSDLAANDYMSGDVYLYDIDYDAACNNEVIGNRYNNLPDAKSKWNYKAVETIGEALTGATFVIISILPGTLDEMESDVHTPEKYGIFQSVGDTTGPGGIVRALRTIPMFEEIGLAIKEYCPHAWVINYTNPMTLCVRALYNVFPKIKAFGCCHEVFGTQKFLAKVLDENGYGEPNRSEIKTEVTGVNHFTWITSAKYKDVDIFPLYKAFCEKYHENGYAKIVDNSWANKNFVTGDKVKMELFLKYGYIAAAGDRHLAEFCKGSWFLKNPETVAKMKFVLTPVSYRKEELAQRLERSKKLLSGEESVKITPTGEEGVNQMCALLGAHDLVTNVNLPNMGQIPNLPLNAVVETNAVFRDDTVTPVFAGNVPMEIHPLIAGIATEQEIISKAAQTRDLRLAFSAFIKDPLVTVSIDDAKELFIKMVQNTKKYLDGYNVDKLTADML